ncbi:acyl-CoA N-acyltransferase [Infundibulicybe gibba]|nr:acyl-CoA N-acyltransferase [Infundibulicybe gibba]
MTTKGDPIKIRYYQHGDADQVRKLFLSSMVDGPNSPHRASMNSLLSQPPYIVGYALIISGLLASVMAHSRAWRLAGGVVAVVLVAAMMLHRQFISQIFMGHMKENMNSDLAGVAENYKMRPVAGSSCELEPSSHSAFWVAETSTSDGLGKEIVGCVGLNYYTRYSKEDPSSAELRRMVVSCHHRRRGIGSKLLKTLILYAQKQGLRSVMLSTPSFQTPAIAMYQRLGWVVDKEIVTKRSLMEVNLVYLRLDLNEEKRGY